MQVERVVVDASPLICLHKSGLLSLLPSLFAEIIVPEKVLHEITAKAGIDLSTMKQFKLEEGIVIPTSIASWDLGEGESAVLAFALKNPEKP